MHPEGLLNTGEVFGLMVAGARFASGVILRA